VVKESNKEEHLLVLNNKAKLPLGSFGSNVAQIDFEFRAFSEPSGSQSILISKFILNGRNS
jgi:hypothetical protein